VGKELVLHKPEAVMMRKIAVMTRSQSQAIQSLSKYGIPVDQPLLNLLWLQAKESTTMTAPTHNSEHVR
jgi:hypothetical protein